MNHIFPYVMREEATDRSLIDGIGCSPETAMEEFQFVKERFRNTAEDLILRLMVSHIE